MSTEESSRGGPDWITPVALGLHALAWIALGGVFYLVVPRHKAIFEDFGVELPSAAMMLIAVSDFVVKYFYLLVVPLGLFLALDGYVVGSFRSASLKIGWSLFVLIIPLVLLASTLVLLANLDTMLLQQLD